MATDTGTAAATERAVAVTTERRRWVALALLCVAQLMLILDVTVVNVALPDIGADLHLHRVTLPWVMTAYTLVFGGLMLLGGRVSDLFGARRVLLAGLTVFVGASLMTGLADGAPMLLGGRAAQGLGAALMSPAALSLVTTSFTGRERAKALAVWAALSGAGSALGVVLGGVLTSGFGWRWVFAINVPIGLAVLVVLPTVIPATRPSGVRAAIDVPGALTVTSATGAAIYGLINVGSHGWSAASTVMPLAASALLYGLFVVVERSVAAPLIPVRLLTRRPVAAGSLLMLVATGLLVGAFFIGSFYLQRVRGYSAVHTGLAFVPIAVATVAGAYSAGRALVSVQARTIATAGLAMAGIGMAIAALWRDPAVLVLGLSVAALGIGVSFVTAFTTALAGVEAHESGMRSGVVNTFHELGGAIGVAVVASIAGAGLTAAHPGGGGFGRSFAVAAAAALAAAVVARFLVPAGRAVAAGAPQGH